MRPPTVPEPRKEGEGKKDEHKSGEALRLCASTQGYPADWSLSESNVAQPISQIGEAWKMGKAGVHVCPLAHEDGQMLLGGQPRAAQEGQELYC